MVNKLDKILAESPLENLLIRLQYLKSKKLK